MILGNLHRKKKQKKETKRKQTNKQNFTMEQWDKRESHLKTTTLFHSLFDVLYSYKMNKAVRMRMRCSVLWKYDKVCTVIKSNRNNLLVYYQSVSRVTHIACGVTWWHWSRKSLPCWSSAFWCRKSCPAEDVWWGGSECSRPGRWPCCTLQPSWWGGSRWRSPRWE